MIERCETLIVTILSCVVLLQRQIRISLASFKPVEPVLNGQPVLSAQLAIPQGWPFNTGLTVLAMPELSDLLSGGPL